MMITLFTASGADVLADAQIGHIHKWRKEVKSEKDAVFRIQNHFQLYVWAKPWWLCRAVTFELFLKISCIMSNFTTSNAYFIHLHVQKNNVLQQRAKYL